MITVRYLLALVVAIVASLSMLMLMEHGRTLRQRLRDFSFDGDSWALMVTSGVILALVGAVIGSLLDHVDGGVAAGIAVAVALWICGLIWANRERKR